MRQLGEFLSRRGISVIAPRLPGHGTSPDDLRTVKAEDHIAAVSAAIDNLQTYCDRIYVMGVSIGGTISLHMGAVRSDLAGVGDIGGPVMPIRQDFTEQTSDPSSPELIPVPWRANPYWGAHDPQAACFCYPEIPKASFHETARIREWVYTELEKITVPVRLYYCDDDALVDPENGEYILKRLGSVDKELVRLRASAHQAQLDFDMERVGLDWLDFMGWRAQRRY